MTSEEKIKLLLQDTSDTDTYIRNRVKGILTDFEINGDSYGVPTIEDIVDLLCEKIEGHKEEIEKEKNNIRRRYAK